MLGNYILVIHDENKMCEFDENEWYGPLFSKLTESDLKHIVHSKLGECLNIQGIDNSFTVTPGMQLEYFLKQYELFQKVLENLNLYTFSQDEDYVFQLSELIESRHGAYIYYGGTLYTADHFMRVCSKDTVYYLLKAFYYK